MSVSEQTNDYIHHNEITVYIDTSSFYPDYLSCLEHINQLYILAMTFDYRYIFKNLNIPLMECNHLIQSCNMRNYDLFMLCKTLESNTINNNNMININLVNKN